MIIAAANASPKIEVTWAMVLKMERLREKLQDCAEGSRNSGLSYPLGPGSAIGATLHAAVNSSRTPCVAAPHPLVY